jgi:hypothetical protein
MRLFFLSLLILVTGIIIPGKCFSQEADEQDTVNNGVLMRREKSGSIMLHTLGYGLGYKFGLNKDYFKRRIIEFDLLEMKAPNQVKTYNENFINPKYYYFGKLNNLYILRAGLGYQHLLNRKPYWGGIEVRYFYSGGLSLGFAKPVYLYISSFGPSATKDGFDIYGTSTEKFNPDINYPHTSNDTTFDIYGRAPVLMGFNEIKPYPGLYAKAGFNFEFGVLNDRVKALEIGVVIDGYPVGVPVIAYRDPYHLFVTAYFSFNFGKRFN